MSRPSGSLFPQPLIVREAKSRLRDQVVGSGLRILVDGRRGEASSLAGLCAEHPDLPATMIAPAGTGKPSVLEDAEGALANWFDRLGVGDAIVRPDHYVFGTARDALELGDLLRDIDARLNGKLNSVIKTEKTA